MPQIQGRSASTQEKARAALLGFREAFDPAVSARELVFARAPGRVNLIGEHTDYNDGFVFPMAIDREIVIVGRNRDDRTVRLYSLEYRETSEFALERVEKDEATPWSNYFRGVVDVLQREGCALKGVDAVILGDVPQGAGLSSSAAFEVAALTLLSNLNGLSISAERRAVLGQRAENEFVGVACGIMDQFVSSCGKAEHGLFLDCRSLEYEHVPLRLGNAVVMVVNTNKRRGLVDSEYNARRRECEEGARLLGEAIPGVRALRDVSVRDFRLHEERLEPTARKRCRHVVTECDRVLETLKALKADDLAAFGRLMNESHDSLRDDFEVSCKELDTVVEIARSTPGVYGARMTGAGFGGCAVALVDAAAAQALAERIVDEYPKATGLQPDVFVFSPADGAGLIDISALEDEQP